MAHHPFLREQAIALRTESHLSIDEIAARLALPRTTIYSWVRTIPLGRRSRANPRGGAWAQRAKARQLREEAYAVGVAEFAELCADPTFRDFVCMYIGEGYKRSRNSVAIANSDPAVIRLGNHWIRRFARNKMNYRVQHHADQSVEWLREFWSAELGVAPEDVRFTLKSNSGQMRTRKWRCQYGVMSVASWDTNLRSRLQGWIDCLVRTWP